MKLCGDCGTEKHAEAFHKHKKSADGLQFICKVCSAARVLAWRRANPEKDARNFRKAALKRNYGLSVEQYEAMHQRQGGVCAICKEECPIERVLSVDHCHTTGRVRGLLCSLCNKAIGLLKDSPERLRAAINYLSPAPEVYP
jgi:hypothetical protein